MSRKTGDGAKPTKRLAAKKTGEAPAVEWWRGAVIYQVYPRSFKDTNDDGVGDLPGIIERLDYIAGLGVDGVWISPFFTSPMCDFGYDVSDYRSVDPVFGTLADFDRLVEKAHALGLKVIIDQVYSHTSDKHAWFAESRQNRTNPKADWYVWADAKIDGSPPNNWLSVFGGGAWAWDTRRRQYWFHNFLTSQPDLNLHNPKVQAALVDVGRFWLDRGVDGFRLDAINFAMHDPKLRDNPPAPRKGGPPSRLFDHQLHIYNQSHRDIPKFLERLRRLTDEYFGVFTVAEIGGRDAIDEMKAFAAGDARLNTAYNFDFLYANKVSAKVIKTAIRKWSNDPSDAWPSWAFSNHDAPRVVSRWRRENDNGGDLKEAAKLFLMVLMSLRGNIFLYQGEELGLPQAHVPFAALKDPEAIGSWPLTLGRDGARTPMPWEANSTGAGFSTAKPWLPIDPRHVALAVDAQANDLLSALNFTKSLVALRRGSPALRSGDLHLAKGAKSLLAFRRKAAGEEAYCVFNLDLEAHAWKPPGEGAFDHVFTVGLKAALKSPPEILPPGSGYIAIRQTWTFGCDIRIASEDLEF